MQETTITKQKTRATANTTDELSKVALYTVGASTILIGCWAVVCLFSGMISSGGPVSLVTNFIKAFSS